MLFFSELPMLKFQSKGEILGQSLGNWLYI